MVQMHQHGIIIIVQTEVLQAQPGGGCCLLTIGMAATLACSAWTVRPALATWATASSTTLAVCVRQFLSNLVSRQVEEMARQTHHTQ